MQTRQGKHRKETAPTTPVERLAVFQSQLSQLAQQIAESLQPLYEAMERIARQLRINALGLSRVAMTMQGPGNFEASTGFWQSDMCASWLHDDCGASSLCKCRCHPKENE